MVGSALKNHYSTEWHACQEGILPFLSIFPFVPRLTCSGNCDKIRIVSFFRRMEDLGALCGPAHEEYRTVWVN